MKPIEVLNLLWYVWKRNSWMLDRYPRLNAKLGSGQDHRPNFNFLTYRCDLP